MMHIENSKEIPISKRRAKNKFFFYVNIMFGIKNVYVNQMFGV